MSLVIIFFIFICLDKTLISVPPFNYYGHTNLLAKGFYLVDEISHNLSNIGGVANSFAIPKEEEKARRIQENLNPKSASQFSFITSSTSSALIPLSLAIYSRTNFTF